MADKKSKQESKSTERIYTIPLRKKVKIVPRYKKTNKAIKTVKEFLVKHMKIRDRDLRKIKLDSYVNEFLWARGIKNPPMKVKVKAIKEVDKDKNEIVRVELVDYPTKLKFKKAREEKASAAAEEKAKKKKKELEAAKKAEEEAKKAEESPKESEEKKAEEKEKKSSVVEAGEKIEKAAAKQVKHKSGGKSKQPKHQRRKALAK